MQKILIPTADHIMNGGAYHNDIYVTMHAGLQKSTALALIAPIVVHSVSFRSFSMNFCSFGVIFAKLNCKLWHHKVEKM